MKRQARYTSYALCCIQAGLVLSFAAPAFCQIKAFPQAEGFGASARGGRGGDVYHVTNLSNSGAGSLRLGIESAPSSGRTIVFDVGGWINLSSKLGVDSTIRNLTIAGHTAPGGIGVRGKQFSVGGDDIVIRHMRFRPGKGAGSDNDSINTNNNAQRVIYDHVSAEFSTDGGFDNQATDVTLQFSSVSYGLQTHSTGSLLENPHRLTLHHNLYANNNTRNPKHRVQETLDWVNNVVYNWDTRAIELQGTSDPAYQWSANIDGNYFIAGPDHDNTKPLSGGSTQNYETWWGVNAYDSDGDAEHDGQDYAFGSRNFADVSSAATRWRDTPFPVADEVWRDATTQAAYERVLREFGATPWARDEVDTALHNGVVDRSGVILSHENQLVALGVSNGGFGTLGGSAAPTDTDRDGIPDTWEIKHGTDPQSPSNNGDFDNDGYTDLEEFLNDLGAFQAAGPLEFSGVGRYADWSHWTRRWEPSRLDEVRIDNATATVDAVGQRAGVLSIGFAPESSGVLSIQGGWLEVADEVVVGVAPSASAVLNLSGGELSTRTLSKGAGGAFNFTGGVLHADEVTFDLVNQGGTLSPGRGVGATHVSANLTLAGGVLAIELASATQADQLIVDGDATLGGALDVSRLAGFAPVDGDSWRIVAAGGVSGMFSSVTDGYSVQRLGDDVKLYCGAAPPLSLPGDYNNDRVVDAADYSLWRDSLDAPPGTLANDPIGGPIGMAQYDQWRAHFGQRVGEVTGASVGAVAEPTSLLLVICAAAARRLFSE